MTTPALSVLIPFYNRHRLIADCVASLTAQDMADFEAIIVDDGSTPVLERHHLGAAAADPRLHLMRQDNRGAGAARNEALCVAAGEYVLFLDSDDLLMPGALAALIGAGRDGPFDTVTGNWFDFSAEGEQRIRPAFPYKDGLANAVEGGWSTGSTILKRSLRPRVSETRMPWEMAECYLKALSDERTRAAYVDHDIVRMRQDSPGRLTHLHDHFEPLKACRFWMEMKASVPLNEDRRSAFDRMIFRFLFTLYHDGRHENLEEAFAALDRDRLGHYAWSGRFSPPWFAATFGVRPGLALQRGLHALTAMLRP